MIKRNWELFQSWTMEDSNRISALFNEFNDNERFPALLNFIMGFNYDKKGLYKEAEDVFLKIYEDDVNGAQYWKIINEYRIMNFKNIQKPRPKILSNIYGGRMGLAMIANADVITFIESKKLGYFKTDIIYYNPFENNFSDILEILPEGWKPDYVFIAISEAEPFPTGIELSPYPVVGLPGDPGWRMNKEYHDVKFFDLVVPAMAHYVKPYTLMGANKAIYTSCAGLQGSTSLMYNDKIEKQKQWDVIFTGATSSPLYRNRSHYLWRLLKLADRYKIFIGFFDN
ncbi:hypothetical protein HY745_00120, partial [Candidatus Desantisbacteria bacterium]|nr:hypothetical protein [Candidatus Desantisbacteria bacterium]